MPVLRSSQILKNEKNCYSHTLSRPGYYGHPSGFFYGMSAGTMGSWILIIVIGIVGWIVQARLQSVFAKYARVPFPGGLTAPR